MITTQLDKLVHVIRQGGVIAYPTEGVWGLGCDPWNERAVNRISSIKKRSSNKGYILVGSQTSQFSGLIKKLPSEQKKILFETWPGPCTWIIPDIQNWCPKWVRCSFNSVAVRVSAHPEIISLCDSLMHPILSTSANLSEQAPLQTQDEVEKKIYGEIDAVFSGRVGSQKNPTKIIDLCSGAIIRSG